MSQNTSQPARDAGPLAQRRDDRFRIETAIRFSDLDILNHVNHAAFLTYCEEARIAFRHSLGERPEDRQQFSWPIAEVSVRYLRSLVYPGAVEVQVAVLAVGRTSLTLGYGLFTPGANGEPACAAVATTRSVCVDRLSGRPCPIPDDLAADLRRRIEPATP